VWRNGWIAVFKVVLPFEIYVRAVGDAGSCKIVGNLFGLAGKPQTLGPIRWHASTPGRADIDTPVEQAREAPDGLNNAHRKIRTDIPYGITRYGLAKAASPHVRQSLMLLMDL
jgi:hypothetical protein